MSSVRKQSTPSRKRRQKPAAKSRFEPGRRIGLKLANGVAPAVILVDRGPLAGNGKHAVRIAIYPDDPEQRDEWVVHEDSLDFDFQHAA